jgi:hypothetical protein
LTPIVEAFLKSKWFDVVHPNETETAWLSSLPPAFWTGLKPEPETVARVLMWRRDHQEK